MTIGNIGHQPNPFAWVNEGWEALKERAHSAVTHFASTEENSKKMDDARSGGSWGIVAVDVSSRETEFEARFELPGAVDAEHATARYENGVLIVTVPRVGEAADSRKIAIK